MKANKIVTQDSEEFLEKYINNPSPTGFESKGQQLWLDYIKPYTPIYFIDPKPSVNESSYQNLTIIREVASYGTDILIDSCSKYETPFIVITGHSSKMKTIVEDVVVKYFNLNVREMIGNKGCLIIED